MKNLEIPMPQPVVDRDSLLLTMPWVDWFLRLLSQLVTAERPSVTSPSTAAVPWTPLVHQQKGFGFLRVNYSLRVTTVVGGGSVRFALAWSDDAGARTFQGTLLTTAGGVDFQSVLIYANRAVPITYSVAYTSSGTPKLQYSLDLVVEQ